MRAALLALALLAAPATAQTLPPFTGLVVDAANVLPPATEADLTAKLQALQRDTKRQLVVATIPDLQGYPIEEYGLTLLRGWGVGLKSVDNGAILFVAPNEPAGRRGPRIETGFGLEPVITDIFAGRVIREQMMPLLVAGDVPGAMTVGTDALVAQLRASPEEAQAKVDAAAAEFDRTRRRAPTDRGAQTSGGGLPIGLIFWGLVFFLVILPALRGGGGRRARRSGGGSAWRSCCGRSAAGSGAVGAAAAGAAVALAVGADSAAVAAAVGRRRLYRRRWRFGRRRWSVGIMVTLLSEADHARVTAAVATAERGSAGEIVTALAAQSDSYHDAALHWAILAMLAVPALLAWRPSWASAMWDAVAGSWSAHPAGAPFMVALVGIALAFLLARLLLAYKPLRLALTPGATKTRRVRRQALALFRVGAERRTRGRTGVLIYLSLAERRAEIIADAAIHDHVPEDVWADAMAALLGPVRGGRAADGLVAAVEVVGAVLAEHAPREGNDVNEIPDRLVET
jgi:uncharacterized protein